MTAMEKKNNERLTRAHKQWRGLYGYLAFNLASSFGVV
jgi:hypothetical protein